MVIVMVVVGGLALMKFTVGSDLLLAVDPGANCSCFSFTVQARYEPPSLQFRQILNHFGIILVHLLRS